MTAAHCVLLEILEGVDAIDVDAGAKAVFRQLVAAIGAAHGVAGIEKAARVNFARELLSLRVSRATIRDRLIAHFAVSRPQAYRIIGAALQLSQKAVNFETLLVSNEHINREG